MYNNQDNFYPYYNNFSPYNMSGNYTPPNQNIRQPQKQPEPFRVMPVTSIEEARAAIVDPDTILIFPDFAQGKIYTKQLNMATGTAFFREYSLSVPKEVPSIEYAPMDALNELRGEIDNIKALLNEKPKGAK